MHETSRALGKIHGAPAWARGQEVPTFGFPRRGEKPQIPTERQCNLQVVAQSKSCPASLYCFAHAR